MKTHSESGEARPPASRMATITLRVPAADMVFVKAIIEAHDNLATLRTEDPAGRLLRLYFVPENLADVEAVIAGLAAEVEIEETARDVSCEVRRASAARE